MSQFHVPGMKCQRCVGKIVETVKTRDREAIVTADPATGFLSINSPLPPEHFEEIISDLGYRITHQTDK